MPPEPRGAARARGRVRRVWGIHRAFAARPLTLAVVVVLLALGAPAAHAELTFGGCFRDSAIPASRAPSCTELPTLGAGMYSIEIPPGDPSQLYATADLAGATIFTRDPSTGALSYSGCVPTDIASACPGSGAHAPVGAISVLAFSPDGLYAYASDSYSVNWFSRDPSSGALTFGGCIADTAGHALFPESSDCSGNLQSGIGLPQDLTITPDGQQLYLASPQTNSIASIDIDPSTGALSAGECASAGPSVTGTPGYPPYACPLTVAQLAQVYGVTVSPEGSTLYATGLADGSIVPFARNISTGALTFAGCLAPRGSAAPGCAPDPAGVGGGRAYLTPDGRDVYITGTVYKATEILQIYARSPATGFLGYLDCLKDAANTPAGIGPSCTAVDGLYGIGELTTSPEGRFPYGVSGNYGLVGGGADPYGAVVWFARTPDTAPAVAPPAPGASVRLVLAAR
jgi:hypothetical protein